VARCFIFKPDGIGDFFLSTGVIRLLASEFGEENLTIAVLPALQSVVSGQFPRARVITLALEKKRRILNVFVANCLRCFPALLALRQINPDYSISLRHMRDYFQSVLFYSVRCRKRFVAENLLLGNKRRIRRWTEKILTGFFSPTVICYPKSKAIESFSQALPFELEAHRLLVSALLAREVPGREIMPRIFPVKVLPKVGVCWVCAPFSSDPGKDFPTEGWIRLLNSLEPQELPDRLVLTGSMGQISKLKDFRDQILSSRSEKSYSIQIDLPPSLQEFIDLLAMADCVLTVDTAAAHASTALDQRTLVLFSGQHPDMFSPWSTSSRQLWMLPSKAVNSEAWYSRLEDKDILASLRKILGEISRTSKSQG